MSIVIRDVARDDFDRWLPLWNGYNAFYDRAGPTALPGDVTMATWARFLDPMEPVHALVAERDNRLIGLAHYVFHRSTTMLGQTCYLQDLFTDTAARRQGVGRLLIDAARERARASGAARLYWHTQAKNAAARRLYDDMAGASDFVVYRMDA
jgi:GNAT superfamily N-acetyltransferase